MDRQMAHDLDNYITGHYGEDQFTREENAAILRANIAMYHSTLKETQDFALKNVVPALSKAVLAYGEEKHDQRSLLELATRLSAPAYQRSSSPEFQVYASFTNRMTSSAQVQILKINQANYPFPENISMMLEQCDYWETDAPVIIDWAIAYLEGRMDTTAKEGV